MKRKQRPNVSLLLWLTKEFIILSILSNLVCTALYMAGSWLLTGTSLSIISLSVLILIVGRSATDGRSMAFVSLVAMRCMVSISPIIRGTSTGRS